VIHGEPSLDAGLSREPDHVVESITGRTVQATSGGGQGSCFTVRLPIAPLSESVMRRLARRLGFGLPLVLTLAELHGGMPSHRCETSSA
jgi:hypothetical protein